MHFDNEFERVRVTSDLKSKPRYPSRNIINENEHFRINNLHNYSGRHVQMGKMQRNKVISFVLFCLFPQKH